MNFNRLLHKTSLLLLTGGASITLGFLSFSGMFALWPILPLAFTAFALSVAYEGEIFLQNIRGAWNKLFKPHHLKHQLANEFLREHFPDITDADCPQFFKDYAAQSNLVAQFSHKRLDAESEILKEKEQKKLRDMQKWFSSQLFIDQKTRVAQPANEMGYEKDLHAWLRLQVAQTFLATQSPDIALEECPAFFKAYSEQFYAVKKLQETPIDPKDKQAKATHKALQKEANRKLRDMQRLFSLHLFAAEAPAIDAPLADKHLYDWLQQPLQQQSLQELCTEQQSLLNHRESMFVGAKIFSGLAGSFVGLGTIYLLVEAFSVIPWFAAISFTTWPIFIIPMATIAGLAYGFLTYNAVTDMISNDTLNQWFHRISASFDEGLSVRGVFMATTALFLSVLAIGLTICTAGTWWTVAQNAKPLFEWMGRMPSFIMGVLNPIITGLAALVFNVQNSSESLEFIDEATQHADDLIPRFWQAIKQGFSALYERENWPQMLNPFRILLKLTILPLRIVLFIGHLISIGVTADRMPGLPEVLSALLGIISEGFEDFHYFFKHPHEHASPAEDAHKEHHHHHDEHDHACVHHHKAHEAHVLEHQKAHLKEQLEAEGHNHDLDLPSLGLEYLFYGIYYLAALWDYGFSQYNKDDCVLSFEEALNKQFGIEKVNVPDNMARPSSDWQVIHALYQIEYYKENHLNNTVVNSAIAQKKSDALTTLQHDLRHIDSHDKEALQTKFAAASADPVYNRHRFYSSIYNSTETTATARFVEELPERIGLSAV